MTSWNEAEGAVGAAAPEPDDSAQDHSWVSDTRRDAPRRGSGRDDSHEATDSRPTTAEEAMDAETVEDGFVDESAYAPIPADPPADR